MFHQMITRDQYDGLVGEVAAWKYQQSIWVSIQVPIAPIQIQFPAHTPGKSLVSWTHVRDPGEAHGPGFVSIAVIQQLSQRTA